MAAPEPMNVEGSTYSLRILYPAQASSSITPAEAPLPISTPVSAGPSAPAQQTSPAPSSSRLPDHLMHKNRLQEYVQRSNIPLPVYETVNEGLAHVPRFRSTVWVDGKSYTSPNTFPIRKAAEQDVAKLAFESISKKSKDESLPLLREKTMFCKSILNEFAVKMNLEKLAYNTVKQEGLPVYVSSLVFNGQRYTGKPAKSKKEAEQLVACAAILANLGNSETGTCLSEIVKSKLKLSNAIDKVKGSQKIQTTTVTPIANTAHTSVGAAPVASNNNEMQVALPESSSGVLVPNQEFQMPKQEISPEDFKLPNVSLQVGAQQNIDDGSNLKKRKKNNKKANKKARLNPLPPVAALPLNEAPLSAALPLNEAPPSSALPLNEVPSCSSAIPVNGAPSCSVAQ